MRRTWTPPVSGLKTGSLQCPIVVRNDLATMVQSLSRTFLPFALLPPCHGTRRPIAEASVEARPQCISLFCQRRSESGPNPQRRLSMSYRLFLDSIFSNARVWAFLKQVDEAEAARWRSGGCAHCGAVLHSATYRRKPHGLAPAPGRGCPALQRLLRRLPHDWERRYALRPVLLETFCESARFLGTCSSVGQKAAASSTSTDNPPCR